MERMQNPFRNHMSTGTFMDPGLDLRAGKFKGTSRHERAGRRQQDSLPIVLLPAPSLLFPASQRELLVVVKEPKIQIVEERGRLGRL